MRKFLASVAVLALLTTPAMAEQGQGQGKGGGNGGGGDQQQSAGGGNGNGKGNGGGGQVRNVEKAAERPASRNERAVERAVQRSDKAAERAVDRADNAAQRAVERADRVRGDVVRRPDRVIADNAVRVVDRGSRFESGRGLIDGCPPGLAKKNNGCMPPGVARQVDPWRRADWLGLNGLDDSYRYYDGYMLRLADNNRVLGYVPLLGGALALGNPWPETYRPVQLTPYYQDYYDLGPLDGYRYYDDTIYRVDPQNAAITAIAALLTGDDITVGQPMPLGYDVYNVPLAYRPQYMDGPNAQYRYSDGYIYQLDPETRLVQAAIELLL